jgi:hypothetical protein
LTYFPFKIPGHPKLFAFTLKLKTGARIYHRHNQRQGYNDTAATKQQDQQRNTNPNQGLVFWEFQHFHGNHP